MSNAGSLRLGVTVLVALSLFPFISVFGQDTPTHGLKGFYYSPDYLQRGISYDEYWMPTPSIKPVTERIDAQIAFGRSKGFIAFHPRVGPWAPDKNILAVIWRGFIHLPKAGTYYIAPVSQNGSEVFLQQARVALNGQSGGFIASEAFTYPDLGFTEALPDRNPATFKKADDRYSYLVPVTVDRPRDFPIEVRVVFVNMGETGFGIDLYWVTPDSPKGDDGKPIAEIVPSNALFVDPPREIPKPMVSGASSTIAADYLYAPADGLTFTTLTIRLADQQGRPVAGKRVHVSTLLHGRRLDTFMQPEQLTDENGITTARFKSKLDLGHRTNLQFFATDVTDLVDAAQVAHVTLQGVPRVSFLPYTPAPYYGGRTFAVEPQRLVVGQPTTIKVPVMNRADRTVKLNLRFSFRTANIGAREWDALGSVEDVTLRPGEQREVSYQWTPQTAEQALSHFCFRVELTGEYLPNVAALDQPAFGIIQSAFAEKHNAVAPETRTGNFEALMNWVANTFSGGLVDLVRKGEICRDVSVGSFKVGACAGVEQSGDATKIGEGKFHVKKSVGPIDKTLFEKSGVAPAPAIKGVWNMHNNKGYPQRRMFGGVADCKPSC